MKKELQRKLLDKYPEFFTAKKKIYIGEKPMMEEVEELSKQKEIVEPIQFGFECGDGWYVLLDGLMAEIQQYIKNHNEQLDRSFKYQFLWNVQRWFRLNAGSPDKNWKNKIADFIYDNAPKGGKPHISINVTQVKEKFGGLCFYYHGGDKNIDGMVRLAESLSYRVCEYCGTTNQIGYTQGWICTICKPCYDKNERAQRMEWKARSEN